MTIQNLSLEEELARFEEFLKEEKVSEADVHSALIHYLLNVLEWLYRAEGWYMNTDMGIFQPGYSPVSPDIALHKGLVLSQQERNTLSSWRMDEGRPAPTVVFEITSPGTWTEDIELDRKPLRYRQMGVKEYFVYDPHTPRVWRKERQRLRGWRYSEQGTLVEQELLPDEQGRLYSQELDSYLQEDGPHLRLLDQQGQRRLMAGEVANIALEQAEQFRRQELEVQQEAERLRQQELEVQQEAERLRQQELEARQENEQLRQQLEQLRKQLDQRNTNESQP